mmetsp:Transcript_17319/g.32810  ORF Transcript_17319/g.32810 Transcript_17319/m.32810 type:complete len:86 (-) Transcript_17319:50-307(-)
MVQKTFLLAIVSVCFKWKQEEDNHQYKFHLLWHKAKQYVINLHSKVHTLECCLLLGKIEKDYTRYFMIYCNSQTVYELSFQACCT